MTHDRRSAPTNGLWLCETHAKLIDTDVSRFPTDLLHRWKRQLRHLNQRAVDHGLDIADQTEMIRLTRRCSLAEGNLEFATAWIGDFLDDVGASSVWGAEIADAARQALTELAQNDAQHGGASWARLESREYAIRLSTDGAIFSLEDLLGSSAPRGGGATISAFQAAYRDTHVLSAPRPGRRNVYFITDVRRPQRAHNPCSVSASELDSAQKAELLARLSGCPEVHVHPERRRWTISGETNRLRGLALSPGIVVVLHGMQPGPMSDALIQQNPHLAIRLAAETQGLTTS